MTFETTYQAQAPVLREQIRTHELKRTYPLMFAPLVDALLRIAVGPRIDAALANKIKADPAYRPIRPHLDAMEAWLGTLYRHELVAIANCPDGCHDLEWNGPLVDLGPRYAPATAELVHLAMVTPS